MAHKEDVRERLRRTNPTALAQCDELDRIVSEAIGEPVTGFTITEDMTDEEILMQLIESQLKQGYSLKDAEAIARDQLEVFKQWEKEWEEEDRNNFLRPPEIPEISGTA
jgi:hypothetical protein